MDGASAADGAGGDAAGDRGQDAASGQHEGGRQMPDAVVDAIQAPVDLLEPPVDLLKAAVDLLEAAVDLIEATVYALGEVVQPLVCPGRSLHGCHATGPSTADVVVCVTTLRTAPRGARGPDTMGG